MRRRRVLILGSLLLVGLLSALDHAGVFGYRGNDRLRYGGATATITHAVDGDTIDVDIPDGRRPATRIRLRGVDCPEIAHEPGEHDAYYGREAAGFVREHLVGRRVRLALDPNRETRDQYGRLLAYVFLAEDLVATGDEPHDSPPQPSSTEAPISSNVLNEILLERGLAYADARFPHLMSTRFAAMEKAASRGKMGLWSGVTPEDLPDWRRRMSPPASP